MRINNSFKDFNRLGINIIPTVSDNGVIGGKVAEEFQAATKLGEDIILYDEKQNIGMLSQIPFESPLK